MSCGICENRFVEKKREERKMWNEREEKWNERMNLTDMEGKFV